MGEPKDVVTWMPTGPGIWRVTMASPPANALSGPLLDGLAAALDAAEAAGDVKVLGAGGTERLPRLVGRGRALDIMLTARQVPAAEALAIGLVDRLTDGDAAEAALALAGELAVASLPAQRAAVAACDLPLDTGLGFEAERVQALFEHGEAAEGTAAFTDKRPPRFA
jgi:enoyl-CoA hydratase/carnithine racemase